MLLNLEFVKISSFKKEVIMVSPILKMRLQAFQLEVSSKLASLNEKVRSATKEVFEAAKDTACFAVKKIAFVAGVLTVTAASMLGCLALGVGYLGYKMINLESQENNKSSKVQGFLKFLKEDIAPRLFEKV
jgi:hypothetical protein